MENTVEISPQVLKIALVGLLTLQSEIKMRVEEIQNLLTPSPAAKSPEVSRRPRASAAKKQPGQKRKLSAAARARIAAAQKERWAAFRAKKANKRSETTEKQVAKA